MNNIEVVKRTPNIPKDSLSKMLKDIGDYIAQPNANRNGFDNLMKYWSRLYYVDCVPDRYDTISYIHVGCSLNNIDSLENEAFMVSYRLDSTSWFTIGDLVKAFGAYEKGVFDFDNKLVLQIEENGSYAVFTQITKSQKPVYFFVHDFGIEKSDIRKITIKKDKHFYFLKNS